MPKAKSKSKQIDETDPLVQSFQEILTNGHISSTKSLASHPLAVPSVIEKCQSVDIAKKGSARVERHLFVLPGLVHFPDGQQVGEVVGLGSQQPKVYLNVGKDKVLYSGIRCEPASSVMAIQFNSRTKTIKIPHEYKDIVAFDKPVWIGNAAENVTEDPLPIPAAIQTSDPPPALAHAEASQNETTDQTKTAVKRKRRASDADEPVLSQAGSSDAPASSAAGVGSDSDESSEPGTRRRSGRARRQSTMFSPSQKTGETSSSESENSQMEAVFADLTDDSGNEGSDGSF